MFSCLNNASAVVSGEADVVGGITLPMIIFGHCSRSSVVAMEQLLLVALHYL